jgi:hypothetical protein
MELREATLAERASAQEAAAVAVSIPPPPPAAALFCPLPPLQAWGSVWKRKDEERMEANRMSPYVCETIHSSCRMQCLCCVRARTHVCVLGRRCGRKRRQSCACSIILVRGGGEQEVVRASEGGNA